MKRIAFILLSVVAIVSLGCTKVIEPQPVDPQLELTVTGDINVGTTEEQPMQSAVTRAEITKSRTAFVEGDKIGVFVVPYKDAVTPGELFENGNYADNVPFIRDAAGVFAPSTADRITFPSANTHIDIFAFAMYHTKYNTLGANPKAQVYSVATDQSAADGSAIVENDLMTAQKLNVTPGGTTPNLFFVHRLAMVRVKFTTLDLYRGAKVTAAAVAINNVITEAMVNMTDTSARPVTNGVVKQAIKAYQFSSKASTAGAGGLECEFEAVVVPQTVVAGEYGVTVTLTTANGTFDFRCELPAGGVTYSSGNVTNLLLKFESEYKLTIASSEIKPWGDGGKTDINARKSAVLNFTVQADPNGKAETIKYANLGIDNSSYKADVVLDNGVLRCNYLQPELLVGDKLRSLEFTNATGATVAYVSAVPQITSNGVIIFGDPTQQGYAEIISAITFN